MKILLSAGHGGTDSGSIGADKGKEKTRTMEVAKLISAKLKEAGHKVTVKQEKNSKGEWVFKNRTGYDYALSIHFNAYNGKATGVECLYKSKKGKATDLSKKVAKELGLKNRGAKKRTDLYMLNIGFDNLIEICFHDNPKDLEVYNKNKKDVANIIAEIINDGKIETPKKSVDQVAREVIQGKWGNGQERKDRLTKAGYNYTEVQNRVNQLLR